MAKLEDMLVMHCMTNAVLEYHFYLKIPSTNCSAKRSPLCNNKDNKKPFNFVLMALFNSGCSELELNMGCTRSVEIFASHYYYNHVCHALLKTA